MEVTKMLLINAVSVNMIPQSGATMKVRPVSLEQAREILEDGFESAIGHTETANVVGGMLGMSVPPNRVSVQLSYGDEAIVAQYIGPRLPEGATSLPAGSEIKFFHLTVVEL
jgi:hypothetical protein